MNSSIWIDYGIMLGVLFTSLGGLMGTLYFRRWRLSRRKLRSPITEKLLRGPGESLRNKIQGLEEEFSEHLALAFVLPLLCTNLIFIQPNHDPRRVASILSVAIMGGIAYLYLCRKIFQVSAKIRHYRLGLSGERAVGEELNRLMLSGCHVFHDLSIDPYGNIDHVLVAPDGVYAVETKARRKKNSEGSGAHRAVFDGRSLRFGAGPPEFKCLEQAKRQSSQLSDWLSKAVGEPVGVQAVLALPGWLVDRKGKGEVCVVSGREMKSLVGKRFVLERVKLERIVHQLEQRCRDVEF